MQVVVLLHPFIFIGNEMEDGNVRLSMKRKGQRGRTEFCVNFAQLFTFSYLTKLWKMLSFKNTSTLFFFSSTIGQNTNTVHWRICFLMKQSHIREWEDINCLINFKWALIRREKAREIKPNLSLFVGISNTLVERYYNEKSCWETPYKRFIKENRKVKSKAEDFKTSNLWLKIGFFLQSSAVVFTFRFTF